MLALKKDGIIQVENTLDPRSEAKHFSFVPACKGKSTHTTKIYTSFEVYLL